VSFGIGIKHRMHNTGGEVLIFVEVQTGTYYGEEDIIRIEDDFGR
jgi:mannose-6-phosphate isomerase